MNRVEATSSKVSIMRALASTLLAFSLVACKKPSTVRPLADRESTEKTCVFPADGVIDKIVNVDRECAVSLPHGVHVTSKGELVVAPGARLAFFRGTAL